MTLSLTGAGLSASTATFDAALYGTVIAWHKADSGTSTTTDAVGISQWDDKSGNAFHLVQATGSKQPLYKTAIQNGKPIVRFDGADDFLMSTPGTTYTAMTIFVVMAQRATGAFAGYVSSANSGSDDYLSGVALDTGAGPEAAFDTCVIEGAKGGGADYMTSTRAFSTFAQLTAKIPNSSTATLYVNGTAEGTFATGAGTIQFGRFAVGCRATSGGGGVANAAAIDVGEVVVYNAALSDANRQAVEAALKSKWGTP